MSQEQPQRPKTEQDAIKYGDLFNVSGQLASTPIPPQDAATVQAAENMALGQTPKSGPASVMQSAAAINERRGAVGHYDTTDAAKDPGVTVTETKVGGTRIVTEEMGDQVLGQYVQPTTGEVRRAPAAIGRDSITIGEALEATGLSAGGKPVDQSDAAAIQAAEVRATGSGDIAPGGIGATALSGATLNARTILDENKTKLGDILENATERLPADKAATMEDAEGVIGAELRNNRRMATYPGGVAESVAAAARLNTR
ncbi:late embryogenesis abundant protein D-34-like [Diospyros lotus]|uniref:late embryogenesis abundant protein D-34-like n=1 Tax=Diospyros lotus TaxID=55363 RepID=UPI0022513DBC|nr:late embryogenesis abundant protein D-34-like [Diospyros lotus]